MQNRIEIILSGSGGQGLILAGKILAEAAMFDAKEVVQRQSYGPEARGGASKSEIIISQQPIHNLTIKSADILLCLSQEALDKYVGVLKPKGILILDNSLDKPNQMDMKIINLPIIKTACHDLNNCLVLNIIALGILNKTSHLASNNSLLKSILKNVPKNTTAVNKLAWQKGLKLCD